MTTLKSMSAVNPVPQGAIDALVKRAIKSGNIRKDLDPFDLLRALIGVSNVASGPDWKQSARRLVDILVTGFAAERGRPGIALVSAQLHHWTDTVVSVPDAAVTCLSA
jgi:Transcriptional regulator SbtR-like, C-terminal domain